MTTDAQKNNLLEEFRHFLEQDASTQLEPQNQPDLYTLLSELTGLKTEVKAEARQYKNTLDTLSSALATVQEDNKSLSEELVLYKQRIEQQKINIMRSMLLEMVDIYDRLNAGVNTLQHYRPVSTLFTQSKKKDVRFIERFKKGQVMSIRRFEKLLLSYQVKTIDCIGKTFDPTIMSALETSSDPLYENRIVLEVLRTGFTFKGQVLRLADVKVNKLDHSVN